MSGRRIGDDAIVAAGARIGLDRLTVTAIARSLGASEMTIYRRTGGSAGLKRFVAEGIIAAQTGFDPASDDPVDALVGLAERLRSFVRDHPGIGAHLAEVGADSPRTLRFIDASQRAFAERFGWPPATASVLVSAIAEQAVALAELRFAGSRSEVRGRRPSALPTDTTVIRAGAEALAGIGPEERFAWSIRATAIGAMRLLGLGQDQPAAEPASVPAARDDERTTAR